MKYHLAQKLVGAQVFLRGLQIFQHHTFVSIQFARGIKKTADHFQPLIPRSEKKVSAMPTKSLWPLLDFLRQR